jgi:hypothetical protein
MAYALVDANSIITKYPAKLSDLQAANPSTSFPRNPSDAVLASLGLHRVVDADPPAHDTFSQAVSETTPQLIDGTWTQQWSVQDIPQDTLVYRCDYQAFWDALIAHPVYQTIRAQAGVDLAINVCCTEFIAAMGDAKAGRPNKDALQTCITNLLGALVLDEAAMSAIGALFTQGNLHRVYSLS